MCLGGLADNKSYPMISTMHGAGAATLAGDYGGLSYEEIVFGITCAMYLLMPCDGIELMERGLRQLHV